jgi:uncharacterized membrane protein YgcG
METPTTRTLASGTRTAAMLRRRIALALVAALVLAEPVQMLAQTPNEPPPGAVPQPTEIMEKLARRTRLPQELDDLVGPIALYPDPLLAHVLPAACYPDQIQEAARVLAQSGGNTDDAVVERWQPSIQALVAYPDVIKMMNEKIDWTTRLGQAVMAQQDDVMDAIQRVRARVDQAGNLVCEEKCMVVKENDTIAIRPANPDVMYVPTYQPAQVVVARTDWATPLITFGAGVATGALIAYALDWGGHHDHYYYGGGWHGGRRYNITYNNNYHYYGRGRRPGRQRPPSYRPWQPPRRPGAGRPGRPSTKPARPHRPSAQPAKGQGQGRRNRGGGGGGGGKKSGGGGGGGGKRHGKKH